MRKGPIILALLSFGIYGFILWFHIDYAIRYNDMMNGGLTICFGYPIWIAYISILLCILSFVIGYFLLIGKLKMRRALSSFLIIGIIIFVLQTGLLDALFY